VEKREKKKRKKLVQKRGKRKIKTRSPLICGVVGGMECV